MPDVLARCKNCGKESRTGITLGPNAKNITLKDNISACPRCGYMRDIPNGIYESVDNVISYISNTDFPIESAVLLKQDLKSIQLGIKPTSAHYKNIERFLSDHIATITTIGVLISVLTSIVSLNRIPTQIEVNQSINQYYIEQSNNK